MLWTVAAAQSAGVRAAFLDHRGFLDGSYGPACCGHPSAQVDAAMAERTVAVVGAALGWLDVV